MPPLRKIPSEITSLTDQDLAEQLIKYNYTPGPILPSTRSVYERKLFKLQTGEQASPTISYEPVEDDDDDDDGQEADDDSADEEVILQHQQPRMRTTKTTRTEVRKTPPRQPSSSRTSSSNRSQSSQSGKEMSASSKGGLPLWVKFLAIIIVAGLVFLVIKNMEPSSEDPDIPDTLEMDV